MVPGKRRRDVLKAQRPGRWAEAYAFVGLERVGGIMIYDITDPRNASFVDYVNPREGWCSSPVANEVSGTTSVYTIS
ncbi:MAG: hypothetical protein KY451_10425 [Actinobacteria bacterium]|nr:hypothetical protein [Actinomycetota bacterium]MBW3646244.1 hypothetical protein [Actinomycetota bacterium]